MRQIISPGALSDIQRLACGVDRREVALSALKGERLTAAQVATLKELLSSYEQKALQSGPLSTTQLRNEGRLLGREAIRQLEHRKLDGISLHHLAEPAVPEVVLKTLQLQPVRSMLVLDVGCSLESLANASQSGWSLRLGPPISQRSFAHETAKGPCWRIVPMENFTTPPTCGLSKHHAIKEVLNHLGRPMTVEPPDPRLLALGILLHQRLTGERLFPTYTFTDKPHVVVGGATEECFTVESRLVHEVDRKGNENVWLAPVVRPAA